MFHDATSSGARLGGTSLSRFRPGAFPWLLCKTGFAASMPRRRYRAIGGGFCSVKVKLTKGLGIGAGLLVSAHSMARRPVRRGEIVTQGGVKQVWSSRGEGGCHPVLFARKRSAPTREGFLRALPFSWVRSPVTGICEKPSTRFRCPYRNSRDVIRRSHSPDI